MALLVIGYLWTAEARNLPYNHNQIEEQEKYPFIPFGFGYHIEDGFGNTHYRKEEGKDPHHVTGSYG